MDSWTLCRPESQRRLPRLYEDTSPRSIARVTLFSEQAKRLATSVAAQSRFVSVRGISAPYLLPILDHHTNVVQSIPSGQIVGVHIDDHIRRQDTHTIRPDALRPPIVNVAFDTSRTRARASLQFVRSTIVSIRSVKWSSSVGLLALMI